MHTEVLTKLRLFLLFDFFGFLFFLLIVIIFLLLFSRHFLELRSSFCVKFKIKELRYETSPCSFGFRIKAPSTNYTNYVYICHRTLLREFTRRLPLAPWFAAFAGNLPKRISKELIHETHEPKPTRALRN